MTAPDRTHRIVLATLCGLLCLASANAKVTVVTLSQLVDESDVIVYGSFKLMSKTPTQSPAFVQFTAKSVLRGKDPSTIGPITFCNASGEKSPDLSRITGPLVLFGKKQLECVGLSYGNKSIVRVKAGRARTAAMDDQPAAQPINVLLKKIGVLVAQQPKK